MKAVIITIEGKVQGVGMRYFIRRNATKNNLSGYAKNLPNGKVECLIIGESQNIDKIIDLIKNESPGIVTSLSISEVNDLNIINQFINRFEIF